MILLTAVLFFVFLAAMVLGQLVIRRAYLEMMDMQSAFASSEDPGLADLASMVDSGQLLVVTLALVAVAPVVCWLVTGSWLIGGVFGVGIALLPRMVLAISNSRRRRKFELQLSESYGALASSLQAGLSLNQALEALVREAPQPTAYEFALVVRKLRLGADFDSAISDLEERMDIENLKIGLTAIRISRSIGGNLVEIIQQLAKTRRVAA